MYPSFFNLVLAAVLLFLSTVGIGTVVDWIAGESHASLMVNFSEDCSQEQDFPGYLTTARVCSNCE